MLGASPAKASSPRAAEASWAAVVISTFGIPAGQAPGASVHTPTSPGPVSPPPEPPALLPVEVDADVDVDAAPPPPAADPLVEVEAPPPDEVDGLLPPPPHPSAAVSEIVKQRRIERSR